MEVLEQVPGVAPTVNFVASFVGKRYQTVRSLVGYYSDLDPLSVLLTLFIVKFLVSLPLAMKQDTDKCKTTAKLCGNTFDTFRSIASLLITVFIFLFYVIVTAGGIRESGFFSIASYLPLAATVIVSALALWVLQVFKLAAFTPITPVVTAGTAQDLKTGSVVYPDYSPWHMVQKELYENLKSFDVRPTIFYVLLAAALLTAVNKYV